MKINIEKYVNIYIEEKIDILKNYPIEKVVETVDMILNSYMEDRTIFSMANGGNSGTLDHLYCDFTHHPFVSEDKHSSIDEGIKRLNYVNLCSSPAELTGLVNDFGVEDMYVAALRPKIKEGDVVLVEVVTPKILLMHLNLLTLKMQKQFLYLKVMVVNQTKLQTLVY